MEKRGLVLVVGATSSGKSSTLASMIQHRNETKSGHILTIEDPIEYSIEGLNQSQVNPEIGYTFAEGLREILRRIRIRLDSSTT